MGAENDEEGTKQHGADVASNDETNISNSPIGRKRTHRELEVSSNSNDDDDVQIPRKVAKVKREIIPSKFRRPPFTYDGRNQKKPRKKVESKESVIRNNMKTHITDWQNEEDINDLICFLDQSKIHGELYNDNGMSLVNCGDLSRLLDPSGWLGDEISQLHHLDMEKIFSQSTSPGQIILRDVYACMAL
ncbi:hypothetical protein C5167_014743 [Papaver somniferum]|uniref:Uncharacterized protein n=1 Tax=Papaver somniferum TaxID=3469 RepID=A0A4Y7J432_PAPSO|nr:hypothetical protein C5167_014743 [Papaver somniferum]